MNGRLATIALMGALAWAQPPGAPPGVLAARRAMASGPEMPRSGKRKLSTYAMDINPAAACTITTSIRFACVHNSTTTWLLYPAEDWEFSMGRRRLVGRIRPSWGGPSTATRCTGRMDTRIPRTRPARSNASNPASSCATLPCDRRFRLGSYFTSRPFLKL